MSAWSVLVWLLTWREHDCDVNDYILSMQSCMLNLQNSACCFALHFMNSLSCISTRQSLLQMETAHSSRFSSKCCAANPAPRDFFRAAHLYISLFPSSRCQWEVWCN